jgi:hypothetical protein
LGAIVAPLLAASRKFDSLILRQQWPTATKPDVKALVAAEGLFEGDLEALENTDAADLATVNANAARDENASSADANILRSDLDYRPLPRNPV